MAYISDQLMNQLGQATTLGRWILDTSGINTDGVLYTFATPETLVINCRDYETVWMLDEQQGQLRSAIIRLHPSIRTIQVEKAGRPCFQL